MRQLKQRRQLDDIEVLNSYVPEGQEDEEDPAEKDPKLNEILKTSLKEGTAKMNNLLDHFAELQNSVTQGSTEESESEISTMSASIVQTQ